MLNELQRAVFGRHVNVVIDVITHLRHLRRERDAGGTHDQLRAIDVDRFVLPRALPAEEALHERSDERFISGRDRVLPRFVDVENRAA